MKSTVAIALVASFVPFVLASPYHMVKHAERDSVQYEVDYVTDVQVATVYEQVTQYWTGEPAATETVTYSAPETTSAAQTTESAHQRQHGAHSHSSSVEYTIEKTTTPEAAPTTTSTVVAPVPTTTSTVAPAPEPTTTSVVVVAPTLPTVVVPTTQAPVFTVAALPTTTSSTSVETSAASASSGLVAGPADATALPVYTVSGYVATGTDSWSAANMQAGVLQSTNEMRAKWGADPLVWDDDLASLAQAGLNGCGSVTETPGENWATNNGTNVGPTDLVNSWSSEAAAWESSSRTGFSESTGHFTQLVWKATTKVGCASNLCNGFRSLLCNYNPVGNMGDASQNSYVDSQGRSGSYAVNVDSTPVY